MSEKPSSDALNPLHRTAGNDHQLFRKADRKLENGKVEQEKTVKKDYAKMQAPIIKDGSLQKLIMAYFLTGRKRYANIGDAVYSVAGE